LNIFWTLQTAQGCVKQLGIDLVPIVPCQLFISLVLRDRMYVRIKLSAVDLEAYPYLNKT